MLSRQYWFGDRNKAKGTGRLYSGTVSSGSDVVKYPYPSDTYLKMALLKGADVIAFSNKIFMIFNPNSMENIVEEDEDKNDLQVGLHDNYTGMAPFVAPGSGGLMENNTGGFAGFVTLPGGGAY
jgi:hypothetical protein